MDDEQMMAAAIELAATALRLGEAPIAALIARGGQIIGWGWNELVAKRDPVMHAEIAAFRDASGRYPADADDLTLVSTLEPCVMCYGAALLAGVSRIVYALSAPADGGLARVNPPQSPGTLVPQVTAGVGRAAAVAQFKLWQAKHPEKSAQRDYIDQLLQLNGE